MGDKRRAERYPIWPGIQVAFRPKTGTEKVIVNSSNIHEISRVGCSIESSNLGPLHPDQSGTLTITSEECEDKIEDAKIARKWNDGLAFSFNLTQLVDKYCNRTSPDGLNFVRTDYDQVHREIMDIKSCRTNIFVGTLGVIGAIAVAILGIFGATKSPPWQYWLLFASAIPVLLLAASMVSTIHKARGITKRSGYMEALGEYLCIGKVPRFFSGWHKANRVGMRCERYLKMKMEDMQQMRMFYCKKVNDAINKKHTTQDLNDIKCDTITKKIKKVLLKFIEIVLPMFKRRSTKVVADEQCSKVAKNITRKYSEQVKIKPAMLESFTSLSVHIYTIAFLISIVSLLAAIFGTIRTKMPEAPLWLFWPLVVLGALVTVFFVLRCIQSREGTSNKTPRKEASIESFFKFYRHAAGLILPVCLIALLVSGRSSAFSVAVLYVIGAIIAVIGVSVTYSFYEKIRSLRRGRYSIQRWRHIWKIRFERCPLMIEPTCFETPSDESLIK